MPGKVVLAGACIASAIGNSPRQALRALRRGESGIRACEDYLHTAALLPAEGDPPAQLHPRLSSRFASALTGFCARLAELAAGAGELDRLLLVSTLR